MKPLPFLCALLASLSVVSTGSAFTFTNRVWPDGPITIQVQLDQTNPPTSPVPSSGLLDGTTSWNASVLAAVAEWNTKLVRSQINTVPGSTAEVGRSNGVSNIAFADDVYGEPFGDRVLAVALTRGSGLSLVQSTESDILFNRAKTWNAYRGNVRASSTDVRRVALHELGHTLGLGHPDEDVPVQAVAAIMNSTIGNLDTLQADDITGVKTLYDSAPRLPAITRDLVAQNVLVGGQALLAIDLDGAAAPPETPLQRYAWTFLPDLAPTAGEHLFTRSRGRLELGAAQLEDAGTYRVRVETPNGAVGSSIVPVSLTAIEQTPTTRLGNLSTRGLAGTGEKALIVGFVVSGTTPQRVLVRAIGATLRQPPFNLANSLANPSLTVFDADNVAVARNDDWQTPVGTEAANGAALATAFAEVGAFALGDGSADAAVLVTLAPGSYTAVIDGAGQEGVAIVELYDAAPTGASRLINLSTRGYVGTDSNILIAGLNVRGPGARTYLVRVAGDTLKDFGIDGTLDDPLLTVFDGNGTLLRELDDWDSPEFLQPSLRETMANLGAFALTDRQESVLRLTLNPGSYTLQVSGLDGGKGIALVEVYEIPFASSEGTAKPAFR